MFWKQKTALNSAEYEFLHKRLAEQISLVAEQGAKIAALSSECANLRALFNKKVAGTKKVEEDNEMEGEKDINNRVILPHNGIFK